MTQELERRLAGLSPEKRRLLELRLRGGPAAPDGGGPAPRPRDGAPLPLSFAQQRLWLVERMAPGGSAYNVPHPLRIRGPLDAGALARALDRLRERHEALRTVFAAGADGPVQRVEPFAPVPLPVEELSHLPAAAREAELRRRVDDDADTGFDLERGPPLRARLLRLGEDDHALLLTLHHAFTDGWSMGILARELGGLYAAERAGRPDSLPGVPLQYADFALWQREWLRGEVLERHLAFWRGALEGAPAAVDLPADRSRPPVPSGRGGTVKRVLPAALADRLRAFAREEEATLFTVLLAAFRLLLARASGEEDVVVGTPVAGRTRREVEGTVGFFVNTLPLRTRIAGDPTFRALVAAERATVLGAFQHQELPFERIVEALRIPRDASRNPLFQAMLTLQTARMDPVELEGCRVERIEVGYRSAKFDLTFDLYEEEDGAIRVEAEFATDLFEPETAERMVARFAALLDAAVAGPERRASALPRMDAGEAARVRALAAGAPAAYPEVALHELFEARAARTPDAPAVVDGERTVRFGELDRWANRVAHRLLAAGLRPDRPVAVVMERSAALVAGLLGVLKAGGAYVPVDPDYPAERIAYVLEDSGASVALVQARFLPLLPPAVEGIALDRAGALEGRPEAPPAAPAGGSRRLAYLIYTSGSTGRPKGAMNEHRGVVNRILWMQDAFSLDASDAVLQKTPVSFDVSVWELFWPLAAGARLVMAPPGAHREPRAVTALVVEAGITTIHFVPSMLRAWLDSGEPERCGGLRRVVCSGEALAPELVRRFAEALPGVELHNLYGPTEAAVDVTHWPCDPALPRGVVPIGGPVANTTCQVLDPHGRPVPVGVAGELFLGGVQVGRGYWRRPALTAERFLPDPGAAEPGARAYRTGDRARWLADGTLEYLGRTDFQVKVRGFRVEPGEVEAALGGLPGVRQAVVDAREGPDGPRLVAWVAAEAGADATAATLRGALLRTLPEHLVPSVFVPVEEVPLTPSGKVDRRALPEPGAAASAEGAATPRTPAEALLAGIWAAVLGLPGAGVEDDFFAAGGHSLLGTRLLARVREAFRVDLPLRALFEAPTVRRLAARIESARAGGLPAPPPLAPAPRAPETPCSFAQERMWFLERIAAGSGAYNMPVAWEIAGPLEEEALRGALEAVVHRHEALRTVLPEVEGGPVQRILPPARFELPRVEVAAAEVPRRLAAEGARPFRLEAELPVRAVLFRGAPDRHWLALTLHHAVADGWSFGILFREVAGAYAALAAGRAPEPAPAPLQYPDFAAWQRRWLAGEVLEAQLDFWRRALAGAPPLELPTDRPRPPVQGFRGAVHPFRVAPETMEGLRDFAAAESATPFMAALAVWSALLGRYADQDEVVVGVPVAGRHLAGTEEVVGLFVNTLALRTDLSGEPSLRALVGRVRERSLDAFAHQDLPFERLVDALRVERSLARHPLFSVLFSMEEGIEARLELPGLAVRELDPERVSAKFDLSLALGTEGEGWLEYATDLFDAETAGRLAGHFVRLLEAALAEPERPLGDLDPSLPGEREGVTLAAGGEAPLVHRAFARQVERSPEAVAVTWDGGSLTFAALDALAAALSGRLLAEGVRAGEVVALHLPRGPELVVAMLAVLRAGAAYLPVDPELPAARVELLLRDAGPCLVLAEPSPAHRPERAGRRTIAVDLAELRGGAGAPPPSPDLPGESLAYLLHTSGSTGVPKGVEVPHRALAAHTAWMARVFPLAPDDAVLAKTPIGFDASVWEFWAPLAEGARLVLARPDGHRDPAYLVEAVRREGITVLQVVPSLLAVLADEPELETCTTLRRLYVGGEALPWESVRRLRARLPRVQVVNLYGPTEACIDASYHLAGGGGSGTVPLGTGVDGAALHLLDARLRPALRGAVGELCIGGPQVARGYLGRPGLTAERFVPDPFAPAPGARMYRSGDRVRRGSDGLLHYLGRSDQQVKVRGQRVEPGEVEAALLRRPGVRAAAVTVRDGSLAAYVVGEDVDPGALRDALAGELPEAMVPSTVTPLDALPLTSSGKVDRAALPAPLAAGASGALPQTPTEEALAGIWREVLGVEEVARDDRFFDRGGHSLLAMRLLARVRGRLGVDLPIRAVFEAPALRDLAARLDALRDRGGEEGPPLVRLAEGAPVPLSFAQERMWVLDRLLTVPAVYSMPFRLHLEGPLAPAALGRALTTLLERHEALRTVLPTRDGGAVQEVRPPAPVELPVEEAADDGAFAALADREAVRPFDLAGGPLFRARLVRRAPERWTLLLTVHHAVADAWSVAVLVRELAEAYSAELEARPAALPPLEVRYGDYAAWQRARLSGPRLERELDWWREQLAGAPVLELPVDHPRPAAPTFRAGWREVRAGAATAAGLDRLAAEEGATRFQLLLAAFALLLARWSGEEDVVVGTPVAGRGHPRTEGMVGLFVNTLAIRAGVAGAPTFREVVRRVRAAALDAFAHQELPFERLVEALGVERTLDRHPVFQATFTVQPPPEPLPPFGAARGWLEEGDTGTAKFDLTLALEAGEEGISGGFQYAADLFDPAGIDRMAAHFLRLLDAAAAAPDLPAARLAASLDEPGRRRVLEEWAGSGAPAPAVPVHRLFVEQAARTPDAPAVSLGERTLRYRELERASARLARSLAARGVGPETVVGVIAGRTPETVAALLAVLRAGGAYLPLDPGYPAERLRWMLEDSGAALVVAPDGVPAGFPAAGVVDLRADADAVASPDEGPLDLCAGPDSLAYLIHTSGSTGRPKGVMVPHRGLPNLARWKRERYRLGPGDRLLQFASWSFDAAAAELFGALLSGAELVLADPDALLPGEPLRETLRRARVTVATLPPSALAVTDPGGLPELRLVAAAGEALHAGVAARWAAGRELHDAYGPTEATVCATSGRVEPDGRSPSIGRPLAGVRVYLLDRGGDPVPPGIAGELFVGGAGVARGYRGRPALTAERFVPDPFGEPGARLYRTGDRARWRDGGELEFLGRLDEQVKLRGFRIEPGEVAGRMLEVPGVRDALVLLRASPAGPRLVGYAAAPAGGVRPDAVREYLARHLPAHMVPAGVVVLDAFPRTPAGKVDRAALPAPAEPGGGAEPEGPVETALAGVWREVLGVERVGADAGFFELGGHSLLAARLVARIRERLEVELPLRAVFEHPTVRAQARLVGERARSAAAPIPRADRGRPLPLSFAQERLWFLEQLEPGSPFYNVPRAFELLGPLDEDALGRALGEVVRRHEILRTALVAGEEGPVQRILPPGSFRMEVEEPAGPAGAAGDRELERWVSGEARRPFDLARGPLLRARLLRLGAERRVLVLVLHHAAADLRAGELLLAEVAAIYDAFRAGRPSPLPEPALQYADYAAWQRATLAGEELDRQLDHWRRRLEGAPALLALPTDRPRPAVQDLRGAAHGWTLGEEAARGVRELARLAGATPFMVLAAALAAVLRRWSGEEDLVLGTPVVFRPRRELEEVLGYFGNTLPLRVDAGGDPGFLELLAGVREAALDALAHQEVPFERMVEALGVERSLSHAPLFQVMVAHQPGGGTVPERLGEAALVERDAPLGTSRFDLTVLFAEEGERIHAQLEYAAALFDPGTMTRLAEHLEATLRAAAADPGAPVSSHPLLSPEERAWVVERWNATAAPRPGDLVHHLVAARAAGAPHAVAVEWRGERRSYAQVAARAEEVAARLRALGVRPEVPVALALERGIDLPAAVLGVLRAGGAYVAVDPAYPAARIEHMLRDSGAAALVTTSPLLPRLPAVRVPVVLLDAGPPGSGGEAGARAAEVREPEPECLAYLLYTSGSTGVPKGTGLPHRALANLVRWQLARWGEEAPARTLQFASLSFDVSFQEIFCTWAAGGTLVLVDEETRRDGEALLAHLREARVERVFLPFAALQNLAEAAEGRDLRLPALREVVTAGEALRSTPQLAAFFRANPGLRLDNQYGPSETHVVSAHRLPADPGSWPLLPPIGAPVENARLFVLDARMAPVPVGVPGELFAAGTPLGRGYPGRAALTAERWLPDPFAPEPGGRLYRTGDRARWTAAGELEYLGRADQQVKIRGFRVEPGEVEAALGTHPRVREAAVAVRGEGAGRRLVAYVAGADGPPPLEELRAHLASLLPEHMVPAAWVAMDALPLTPSGKTDRRALPEPEEAHPSAGRVPPRTPAEALVAGIWERVLGVRPGVHDDFFALGGHSLRATRVVSRIRDAFGVELPLRALFEAPTVAGLAARAAEARAGGPLSAPPLLPRSGEGPAPLSFAQQRFWFLERMGAAASAYAIPVTLRLRGPLDEEALRRALSSVAARHEALRTVFRMEGGEPVQVVLPPSGVPLPVEEATEAEAERAVASAARLPFDLERGPVFRARLLRIAPDHHVLLAVFHHAAADAWSLDVFFRELAALYRAEREGRDAALPPLPVQYADFAVWQRQRLSGPALERELEHWRGVLAGAATLELPTDHPRPPVQRFRGGSVHLALGRELSASVAELGRARSATPYMVLLAALDLLLFRWSGTADVVVGSPVAGRTPRETEGLVGVFLNTLPLRVDLAGDPSFAELVDRVRAVALDAFAHQEVPFERLLEAVGTERSLSRHPLFQVLFSLQPEAAAAGVELAGLRVEAGEPDLGVSKLDLALAMADSESGLAGALQYASDLWEADTVHRMAGHFRSLLAGAVADPSRPVSSLPLMEAAERAAVLGLGRGEARDHGAEPVHRRVERLAARRPDGLAVVAPDAALTFGQLERRANRLAHRLRRLGVGPDRIVAVALERSAALVTAHLAVLKAGGAYLSLDPDAPPERAGRMLAAAGAVLAVARSGARALERSTAPLLALDREEAAIAAETEEAPGVEVHPDHLAYVIFTSGSTGVPKGVAVPHRGLANLVGWYVCASGLAPGGRGTLAGASTFDVSVLETWSTLASGAALHLLPPALRADPAGITRWLDEAGITVAALSTPVAEAVLEAVDRGAPRPRRLGTLVVGGEALRRRPPTGLRLLNIYGPTENSVVSSSADIAPEGEGLPSIGVPVDRHRCLVLDERMEPVPVGVVGELYVGGPGLARGYVGRPGRTAGAFVPSPFPEAPGERLYRTGDRVRWRADGELEFLGRLDMQVKLRGHRIEPGEVEAALLAHPGVAAATVLLRGEGAGARLVAYVVFAGEPVGAEALRAHLRERLPDYMVPAVYVPMDALPMTPNGKVDRRALPEPAVEARASAPPRSGAERRIAEVWKEVLGVERVGVDDNFFETGGHSLLVARLAERLTEVLDRPVSLVDVFQFPTVGALAAHLGDAPASTAAPEGSARGAGRREMLRRVRR